MNEDGINDASDEMKEGTVSGENRNDGDDNDDDNNNNEDDDDNDDDRSEFRSGRRKYKRHVGPHDDGGLQRTISTGRVQKTQ